MWTLFPAVVASDPACALGWHSDPSAATVINHDVEVWLDTADNVLVVAFADTTVVVADEIVAVVANVLVVVAAAAAEATVAAATEIVGFAGESEVVVAVGTEHVDGISAVAVAVAAVVVVVFADGRAWL